MGRDKKQYRQQRIQRTYMYNSWTLTKGGDAGGLRGQGGVGIKGEKIGKTVIA